MSSGAALGGKNASGGAAAAASGGSADAVAASAADESAFSETDAETEEITEASEALSESEESTEKRRIIVGKQKIKNACHGNMLGIGIYRFGRRSMLYCVLCKETPQKRRKRKIC